MTSKITSLVKLNAPKNIMECEEIAIAADRLKISDNSLTMWLASFIKAFKGLVKMQATLLTIFLRS